MNVFKLHVDFDSTSIHRGNTVIDARANERDIGYKIWEALSARTKLRGRFQERGFEEYARAYESVIEETYGVRLEWCEILAFARSARVSGISTAGGAG
jgi:hypothetical protein